MNSPIKCSSEPGATTKRPTDGDDNEGIHLNCHQREGEQGAELVQWTDKTNTYPDIYRYFNTCMKLYENEEQLRLTKQVAVTREVYDILRKEKTKQKLSMAKIVCNLVIEIYDDENKKS